MPTCPAFAGAVTETSAAKSGSPTRETAGGGTPGVDAPRSAAGRALRSRTFRGLPASGSVQPPCLAVNAPERRVIAPSRALGAVAASRNAETTLDKGSVGGAAHGPGRARLGRTDRLFSRRAEARPDRTRQDAARHGCDAVGRVKRGRASNSTKRSANVTLRFLSSARAATPPKATEETG